VPSIMQSSSEIAGRLELFRSQTLAAFDPADKKESAESEINTIMDNLIGLDNFHVPEVPIVNSRAGLYMYLDAAVRPPRPFELLAV
jgi:mediator of RNA polymerase II transcription subunit 5